MTIGNAFARNILDQPQPSMHVLQPGFSSAIRM